MSPSAGRRHAGADRRAAPGSPPHRDADADHRAVARAHARGERLSRARARATITRQKRDAERRIPAMSDRKAIEGDADAAPVSDLLAEVDAQPVAAAAPADAGLPGFDLTIPLLLITSAATLAIVTRHTARWLRQQQPR